jgi:hypothetical protein
MAKCGMKMPREVAILIAEKSRHSRREQSQTLRT